jgi:ABC-type multidrug transport system fused ATPase/permease subunit
LKQIVRDIFSILSPGEKQKLWKLAVADVFISLLDIGFLIALLYVINFYTQPAHSLPARFISLELFKNHPLSIIVVFFLLFAIKNGLGFMVSKLQYHFVYGVASRISRDNLLRFLNGSYIEYIHVDSSVINRRVSQQPIEFSHYLLNGVQQVFSQTVLISITLAAILIFNPLLLPLLIFILAPPVFLISFLMKRKLNATRQVGKKTGEKSIQHLQEALSGYIESNIYLKNDFFTNRYHSYQKQLNHYLSESLIIQNMPTRLIEVFAVFGLLVLILANAWTANSNTIPLVTIGALMVAAYKIIPGIVKITNTIGQIKTYSYTTAGLISMEQVPGSDKTAYRRIDTLNFEKINFSYGDKDVLSSFSLNLNKGDMMGITGMSGKGKTTFVNILLGFLTPDSGSVYLNGERADTDSRKSYWSRIAYIKQQHFFLHGSIIENITLHDGDYDKIKMAKILTITGIDKMMNSIPGGLDAMITENGKNFSGGQRQRFIFARALYKDFDLLILDEPFNELDELSEIDMLKQLQIIAAEGRIVLLITHNKEALSFCNKKLSMDE